MPASRVRGRRVRPTPGVYPAPGRRSRRRPRRRAGGQRQEWTGAEEAGRVPPRPRPAQERRLAPESSGVAEAADLTRAGRHVAPGDRGDFLEGLCKRAPGAGVCVCREKATAVVLPEHAVVRQADGGFFAQDDLLQREGLVRPAEWTEARPLDTVRAGLRCHTSSCSFADPPVPARVSRIPCYVGRQSGLYARWSTGARNTPGRCSRRCGTQARKGRESSSAAATQAAAESRSGPRRGSPALVPDELVERPCGRSRPVLVGIAERREGDRLDVVGQAQHLARGRRVEGGDPARPQPRGSSPRG